MAMNAATDRPFPRRMAVTALLTASVIMASAFVTGCYSTSGGFMPHTDGGFTYESTQLLPTTVMVLNSCDRSPTHPNGTPFFIMEIPPGKQLTFNFEADGGDDPVNRPARMMYSLWM